MVHECKQIRQWDEEIEEYFLKNKNRSFHNDDDRSLATNVLLVESCYNVTKSCVGVTDAMLIALGASHPDTSNRNLPSPLGRTSKVIVTVTLEHAP